MACALSWLIRRTFRGRLAAWRTSLFHLALALLLMMGATVSADRASAQCVAGVSCTIFGGTLTLPNATYPETSYSNSGTVLETFGGAITGQGLSITGTGFGFVNVAWAGSITLSDSVILGTGDGLAYGVLSLGTGTVITLNNVSVTTTGAFDAFGDNAPKAVVAEGGGTVIVNGPSSIQTSGQRAVGVQAQTGLVELNGTAAAPISILTRGLEAHAVQSCGPAASSPTCGVPGDSLVTLHYVSVQTQGDSAFGLFADGFAPAPTSSILVADNVSVTTQGSAAIGVVAQGSFGNTTSLSITNSSVRTSGAAAFGLFASTGTIIASGVLVETTGTGAHALVVENLGQITASDVVASASGADANALTLTGNSTSAFLRGSLTSASGPAINVAGGLANVSLTGTSVTGPDWLNVAPTATVDLTASAATLSGSVTTAPGGVSNLDLINSTWNMTGSSNATSVKNERSTIQFAAPSPDPTLLTSYRTLTVGSYVGAAGAFGLNTYLGGDRSPSDRLVVDGGTASGTSLLRVANTIGPGSVTTGDGILVVQGINGATTGSGAFALGGIVAAGPYEYQLFRGGLTGGTSDNWYLRSSAPPEPPVPPTPSPAPPVPLYRPEAALDTLTPGIARLLGMSMLGTFHERQGDQAYLRGAGSFPGSWGRVFGRYAEERRSGPLSPELEGHIAGFQVGQDLYGVDQGGHRDRFGMFLGYARADVDARGFSLSQQRALVGNYKMNALSLGAYWTHIGPSGWYVDAVVMGSRFDGDPRSSRGVSLNSEGYGLTASLEGGYPIPFGAGMTLEPQAQLIWQHVSFDGARDPFATIRFDPGDAFTGRLGMRLNGSLAAGGQMLKPYLIANVWRAFSGNDRTTFNVTTLATDFGYTSLEMGGGVSTDLSAGVSLYAAASYTTNLGGDHRRGIRGNLGLRVTW